MTIALFLIACVYRYSTILAYDCCLVYSVRVYLYHGCFYYCEVLSLCAEGTYVGFEFLLSDSLGRLFCVLDMYGESWLMITLVAAMCSGQ